MSTELLTVILGALTAGGTSLSIAFGTFAKWAAKRFEICEEDRKSLTKAIDENRDKSDAKIESMNAEIKTVFEVVGHLRGRLEAITSRNDKIDSNGGGDK